MALEINGKIFRNIQEQVEYLSGKLDKLEDGTVVGGLGTAVSEWFNEHDYHVKVKRVGIPDEFIPHGTVPELYKLCKMDNDSIKQVIISLEKS